MWYALGSAVDVIHALSMVAWIVGLPLLFVARRYPRLTRAYSAYAIVFIVVSQLSQYVLGECFLTTTARWFWEHPSASAAQSASREWFTVRMAKAIFDMSPSERSIVIVSEVLILLTAAGVLLSLLSRRGVRLGSEHR
ncbi:MAG TPA: hypothetical protein VFB62_23760 [Polyangiaceae bacterium]|nr:hypothetical protein [Polyangiaceae bacterium]